MLFVQDCSTVVGAMRICTASHFAWHFYVPSCLLQPDLSFGVQLHSSADYGEVGKLNTRVTGVERGIGVCRSGKDVICHKASAALRARGCRRHGMGAARWRAGEAGAWPGLTGLYTC